MPEILALATTAVLVFNQGLGSQTFSPLSPEITTIAIFGRVWSESSTERRDEHASSKAVALGAAVTLGG
jgi:hypothetical protein